MNKVASLQLNDVKRSFPQGSGSLEVLRGVSLTLSPGEITALVGPSGTGKSTLLHIAGLLERPDSGQVIVEGADCTDMEDNERTILRQSSLGFVYQFHHLLPEFSAEENVVLPQMISGKKKTDAEIRAGELLGEVGLSDRLSHRPSELSGGEQQRVAIARALANRPSVLLADEPTGNLDEGTASTIFEVMLNVVRLSNVSALIATHNSELAKSMDRIVMMRDGVLVDV
ncbi:MAG: ABC transporter [Rhodospirillaceae bacterium]|nr:ABC transporter [Rhodospirillaceae bacterium]|tara:strand:+ start:2438 stop:3121 length:684 start_codon:yes stop_codon:yes gene_type:complete